MVVLLSVLKKLFEGWFGSEAVCLSLYNGHFSRKKQGSREKCFPLYITNGHFFGLCPKKFEVREARTVLSLQKVLSLFNGQNESECHDFVSLTFYSLLYNGHFSSKTWHLFSKNFSCPWSPLYLAKWIRGRFCPRFLKKVSRTERQALRSASNCPFCFPTDKMMRSVTVLS